MSFLQVSLKNRVTEHRTWGQSTPGRKAWPSNRGKSGSRVDIRGLLLLCSPQLLEVSGASASEQGGCPDPGA